jgi:hypothetical protein
LSTGTARIVEVGNVDNPVNRLWGEVSGAGRNMLGVMLMELREELRTRELDQKAKLTRRRVPASGKRQSK